MSLLILRRELVGYHEFAVISTWESELSMTNFPDLDSTCWTDSEDKLHSVMRKSQQVYDLVVQRFGTTTPDSHHNDSCPDVKEGAD